MIWAVIILLAVAADRISKLYIVRHFELSSSMTVIDRFFYITYWENRGAAWGIFQNGRYIFIGLTVIISGVIIYYLVKADNRFFKLTLSLILGGALGNFIDRVYKGSVVDFLDFRFGTYHFPIFNVADSFVVVGTILLAVYLLLLEKKESREPRADLENK